MQFYICTSVFAHLGVHSVVLFTYAHDVHEAVHAIADLEEQVLTLPLGRGAEGGPDEPGDAGDEEKGTQNNGGYLHLLDHRQRDGLPLVEEKNVLMTIGRQTEDYFLQWNTDIIMK